MRYAPVWIAAILSLQCGRVQPPAIEPALEFRSPNVVLITVDGLRPDRMGCYGYDRDTSPNLDRFREECVLFENAFSTGNRSAPVHATLLTSRFPRDHGLLTWNRLADEQRSLAETLSEHGFETGATVNLRLLSDQNLGQGFEWRREANPGPNQPLSRPGGRIIEESLEFIAQKNERPFFLWLNLFDVQRPYGGTVHAKNRFGSGRPTVGDTLEHYDLSEAGIRAHELEAADLAWIDNRYDAGVAYADELLGPLLTELDSDARRMDTLVVITSAHGENLREARDVRFSHAPYLERQVTRVPLMIRLPGSRQRSAWNESLVSLLDVAPTILEVLRIPAPESFQGQSLMGAITGTSRRRDALYSECWGQRRLKAVRSKEGAVIYDVADGQRTYYDLKVDPSELRPFDAPTNAALRKLNWLMDDFIVSATAHAENPELDAETVRRLAAIGER